MSCCDCISRIFFFSSIIEFVITSVLLIQRLPARCLRTWFRRWEVEVSKAGFLSCTRWSSKTPWSRLIGRLERSDMADVGLKTPWDDPGGATELALNWAWWRSILPRDDAFGRGWKAWLLNPLTRCDRTGFKVGNQGLVHTLAWDTRHERLIVISWSYTNECVQYCRADHPIIIDRIFLVGKGTISPLFL